MLAQGQHDCKTVGVLTTRRAHPYTRPSVTRSACPLSETSFDQERRHNLHRPLDPSGSVPRACAGSTGRIALPNLMTSLAVGDRVELVIDSLAYGGAGVARYRGLVILVDGGVPGDRVMAQLTQRPRNFARARVVQILSPSPLRQTPLCTHFGECGGCVYQHVDYRAQLEAKRSQVVDLLERVGGFQNPPVGAAVGSALPLRYRNRMSYAVALRRGGGPGLRRRQNARSILEVPDCLLPREAIQEAYRRILDDVRRLCPRARPLRMEIQAGEEATRPVVLLRGRSRPPKELLHLASRWVAPGGPLAGVLWAHGPAARLRNGASTRVRLIAGQDQTREQMGPYRFRIPVGSFFQAHSVLAAHLFGEVARRCLGLTGGILELFSGVGALSLFLAAGGEPLVTVEADLRAVQAARENARSNGIAGIQFVATEVARVLWRFEREGRKFGAVVLDPPRTGLSPEVAARVTSLATGKILYLSCDPATLARDLRAMVSGRRWCLKEVIPVDLFPQAAGVECLAELSHSSACS